MSEQEQGGTGDYYSRYDESIRIFTVFFAAVLGFGLQNLLGRHTPHKWLFFLVATFIFLRFLTASANLLWSEYQRDKRAYGPLDNFVVIASFFWLTLFGVLGAYLCYASTQSQFFSRAFYLLGAAFVASVIHVPWTGLKWVLNWRTSTWQWALGWFFFNGIQLAVVVLLAGVPSWMWGPQLTVGWTVGWTWGCRLLVLAIASAVILVIDFTWQLVQLAKKPPQ